MKAAQALGDLTGLSHNAGIQRYGTVVTTPEALWDEVIDVNLTGAFPRRQGGDAGAPRNKGAIVLTASVQGMAAQKGALAYSSPSTA